MFFINNIPGRTGIYLRRFFYKILFKKIGKKFSAHSGFKTLYPKNIEIGNNCSFLNLNHLYASQNSKIIIGDNFSSNINVYINSTNGGEVKIGNNVLIGPNVVLRAADHNIDYLEKNINQSGHRPGKIIIKDNVWIGSNCVVTKDVIIEENSVIGAGVTITKNVEKNSVIIGAKQTLLKKR